MIPFNKNNGWFKRRKAWTAFMICPAIGAGTYFKMVQQEGRPVELGMLGLMVGLGFFAAIVLWDNDRKRN